MSLCFKSLPNEAKKLRSGLHFVAGNTEALRSQSFSLIARSFAIWWWRLARSVELVLYIFRVLRIFVVETTHYFSMFVNDYELPDSQPLQFNFRWISGLHASDFLLCETRREAESHDSGPQSFSFLNTVAVFRRRREVRLCRDQETVALTLPSPLPPMQHRIFEAQHWKYRSSQRRYSTARQFCLSDFRADWQ